MYLLNTNTILSIKYFVPMLKKVFLKPIQSSFKNIIFPIVYLKNNFDRISRLKTYLKY